LVVVSDSGPLIALERIEGLNLLPALFPSILIPPAVEREIGLTPDLYARILADAGETPPRPPARHERI
jgi:predicted nucleic acid-binding protein